MKEEARTYLPNLDGWRGYAVLWIALGHAVYLFDLDFVRWPALLFVGGSTRWAVDIFFLIAGFGITEKLFRESGAFPLRQFLASRALRVLPMYAALVAVCFVLDATVPQTRLHADRTMPGRALTTSEAVTGLIAGLDGVVPSRQVRASFPLKIESASYVPDLLLVQNYYPMGQRVRFLEHTWFVAAIVQCYLLYGLLLYAVFRLTDVPARRRAVTMTVLAAGIVAVAALRAKWGMLYESYDQMTHFRIDALFLGCLLSFGRSASRRLRNEGGMPRIATMLLFTAGAFLLASIVVVWPPADIMRTTAPLAVSIAGFGLMLLTSMGPSPAANAVFGNRPMTWIGRNAYGIYLFHYPFLLFFQLFTRKMQWGSSAALPVFLVLSVLIGAGAQGAFDRLRAVWQE